MGGRIKVRWLSAVLYLSPSAFFIFLNRFLVEKGVIIFFLPRLITYCYSYRASSTSLCLSSVTYPPDKSGGYAQITPTELRNCSY